MFYKCKPKLISILLVSLLLFQCFITNTAYSSEKETGIESLDILEASDDPLAFNTNRYIVKYKSEKAREKLHKLLEKNITKEKPLKDNALDVITIKNNVESGHFISILFSPLIG